RLTKYEVTISWDNKVRFVPDLVNKTDMPALVGEVRLRGQGFGTCDDLQVIVDLYTVVSGDVVPHERWIIGPEQLSKTAKKDPAGLDCQIVLPLARHSPDPRYAKLRVRVASTREEATDAGRPEQGPGMSTLPAPWGRVLAESIIEINHRDGAERPGMVP